MFVADAGIGVWIVGLLLLGLFGFFVMFVALVFRLIGWFFRTLGGGSGAGKAAGPLQDNPSRRLLCPQPGCGHNNEPTALYCGRCGRPLRRTYDVGSYG